MHVPVTPLNHSIILIIPDWTSGHRYFITTCKSLLPTQSLVMLSASAQTKPSSARSAVTVLHQVVLGLPLSVLLALRGPTLRVKIVVLVSVRMFSLEGRQWELLQSLLGY